MKRECYRCSAALSQRQGERPSAFKARRFCSKGCAMAYARTDRWPSRSAQALIRERTIIDPETGCWNWQGRKTRGYGRLGFGGEKNLLASRFAYEAFVAVPPKHLNVCHRCDNPSCVNPDHLFVGTQADNVADMFAKRRDGKSGAKLSADEIAAIRSSSEQQSALARRYGVVPTTISNIRKGVSWQR